MIKVFHANHFGRPDSGFTLVATVDTDDMNVAYELTNNIDCSWTDIDHILFCSNIVDPVGEANGGCRSTSVGDRLEVNGELFAVAPIGFERIRA